jgi:predicted amidophosphoribosyltransferase
VPSCRSGSPAVTCSACRDRLEPGWRICRRCSRSVEGAVARLVAEFGRVTDEKSTRRRRRVLLS